MRYRPPDGNAVYEIEVLNPGGGAQRVAAVEIDERPGRVEYGAACIPLFRDGHVHQVTVTLDRSCESKRDSKSNDAPG